MLLLIALLRVALSAIFAAAGVTKLIDQSGTREAVKNFGASEPLTPALALLLPLAELALAAGLLVDVTMWWSALGALLLLGLFVVAISVNLARGRTHDCHCFGQLHSRPLGWPTLLVNIVFALGAVLVLWQGGKNERSRSNILQTLAQLDVGRWLLIAALVVTAALLVQLQRRRKQTSVKAPEKPKGLPLDSVAPPFELAAYTGGSRSLVQLLDYGKPLLLIFTNPNCGPCVALFTEIKDWQTAHHEQLTIALISRGTIKDNFVNVARNRLGQVLLQQSHEVAEQYRASVTPTAVVVNTEGKIASALAAGADEIRKLLQDMLGNSNGSKPPARQE
jgi:uncharacterized membrane protein YphA (DoxX/SURF4 family)